MYLAQVFLLAATDDKDSQQDPEYSADERESAEDVEYGDDDTGMCLCSPT